ncbi:hypothetical protein [Gracilibacillus salinarum]|uniref:DUF8042 domain-containing protein n=1 Tax=Gracilibacillus salinarum TaxID=2932255 RepID=A0ABY4GLS1_9BACI|nr:hypothetical protein [Gracilibacillus salinarum]UOQ85179.1 hypothetical protein MUN87_21460 [Gracilibacillus salinarum]
MNKQPQVMQQSLHLSETIEEGVLHIQSQLKIGELAETFYLFEDVVQAFASIETAVEGLDEGFDSASVQTETNKLRQTISLVVDQYEANNIGKVQEILQFSIVPAVKRWRTEMENAFHPHILN